MSRISKSPAHLVLRGGIYYFRFTIPGHLRPVFQKREIKRTLKTGYLVTARKRASFLGFRVSSFMDTIKQGSLPMLSESERQSIVAAFKDRLKSWILEMENTLFREAPLSASAREQFKATYSESRRILEYGLHTGDFSLVSSELDAILAEQGIVLDKESVEYRKLAYVLIQAHEHVNAVKMKKLNGNLLFRPESIKNQTDKKYSEKPLKKQSMLLSEIMGEYSEKQIEYGKWMPESARDNMNLYKAILKIFGDRPVNEITKKTISQYIDILHRLKSDWNSKNNKDLPSKSLLASSNDKKLTKKRKKTLLAKIKTILDYAVQIDEVEHNVAKNFQIDGKDDPKKEGRQPFNQEMLRKLFFSDKYMEDTHDKAWKFWLPILGMYTGARIEELCQAVLTDVQQIDGVWCMAVIPDEDTPKNDAERGKKTKTDSSKRVFPLHPDLLNIFKFHEYVNAKKKNSKNPSIERIFDDLVLRARVKTADGEKGGRYSRTPSDWFSTYTIDTGVREERDNTFVFHSFRHLFCYRAANCGVQTEYRRACTGHEGSYDGDKKAGDASYMAHGYELPFLLENVMEKIDFQIDLKHLQKSRWIKYNPEIKRHREGR